MRKVVYGGAMSLDGFIAGPNGEYDWIVMDPDIDFAALMGRFDTFLIGRKTFEAMRRMGGAGTSAPGDPEHRLLADAPARGLPAGDAQRRCGGGRRRSPDEAGQGHRALWRRRAVPKPAGGRASSTRWASR